MKEKYLYLVCTLVIILTLFAAGCISPPSDDSTINPLGSGKQNKSTPTATPRPFVSVVSVTDSATIEPAGYSTFVPATPIPADITCRIHNISLYGSNATAFVFNLKNPPMYINYTVFPKNVTKTETFTQEWGTYAPTPANTKIGADYIPKTGKGSIRTVTYSDYSPTSWFEITVRDYTSKEIILQEGFGEEKGYSVYLNRSLKIIKTGDILVEFRGNDLKSASATIWVKPIGNVDESRLSEFTNCMYWDAHRDTLPTAKPTTIKGVQYTWTPENKMTSKAATMVTQGTEVPRNQSDLQR